MEAQAAKYCDHITKHSPAGCTSLPPSVSLSLYISMQNITSLYSDGSSKSFKYIQESPDVISLLLWKTVLPQSYFRFDCFCCQWNGSMSSTSVIPKSHVGKECHFSRRVSQTDEWALCQSTSTSMADLHLLLMSSLSLTDTHIIHFRQSLLSSPVLLRPVQNTMEAQFNKQLSNRYLLCFRYAWNALKNIHWYKIWKIKINVYRPKDPKHVD